MSEKGLNERQKRFVDFYIKTSNASESARLAGYSEKNANVDGSKLLANPNISKEIKRRLKELESSRTADVKETLEYLTAVMRGEMKEVIVVTLGTGNGYSKAEKIEVPVSTRDRLKAAEHLLKVYGAFKNEVQVAGVIPIVISGGDELED